MWNHTWVLSSMQFSVCTELAGSYRNDPARFT